MVEKMVSLAEAAEIVGVHPVTLRRLIKKGELRATRVGRQWRVPLSDLTPSYQEPAEEPQAEREPVGAFTRLAASLARTGGRSA